MDILIVDDEPLARTALANALIAREDIDHFDLAKDAVEALDKIDKHAYDLLLLDINMPELSGLGLLERLNDHGRAVPAVIFVTAHEEYAIAAFRKHAVDYVLKPFSSERIDEALDMAFRRSDLERTARLIETLPHLQKLIQQPSVKIAIKANGKILFIRPNDVLSVHAEGNYVLLQREVGSYLLRESISILSSKLKPFGFIRIHRSTLVNTSYVEEIQPRGTGEYMLRIKGGKEFTVTRNYKANLKNIATSWLGIDAFAGDDAI